MRTTSDPIPPARDFHHVRGTYADRSIQKAVAESRIDPDAPADDVAVSLRYSLDNRFDHGVEVLPVRDRESVYYPEGIKTLLDTSFGTIG